MRASHLWGLFGVLIGLTVILTGCSLLLQDEDGPSTGAEELTTVDRWVIAAQGQEEPAACEQDLSRSEARQEAKEALKEDEEAQQLRQVLAALGKRVMPWRAQGCQVSTDEEGDASAQGLSAQQTGGPETVLVEVPAGADAALYLVETNDEEGNYWVSLKESTEDGEVLTHIEVGLAGETEVQGLSLAADTGAASFLLPNESVTQEIVGQVQQLLEGSAESAGLRALGTDELDWSRAEVLLLDGEVAEGEEVEALLVIPAVDDGTGSQALWGRTRTAIDPGRATSG
jgi:predicted RNase H-like HicB family nuclease